MTLVRMSMPDELMRAYRFTRLVHCDMAEVADAQRADQTDLNCSQLALSLFPLGHCIRRTAIKIITHPVFDPVVLTIICLNCITLVFTEKDFDGAADMLQATEIGFLVIFAVESCIKILALGFVMHRGAYLQSSWNRLDFFVVVVGIVQFMLPGSAGSSLTMLRALRVLRPLRITSRLGSIRSLIDTIAASLPLVFDVFLLLGFLVWVFAILGLQLWSGAVHQHCFIKNGTRVPYALHSGLTEGERSALAPFLDSKNSTLIADVPVRNDSAVCGTGHPCTENGVTLPQTCRPDGIFHGHNSFDNIFEAVLVVFKGASLDDWPDDMHIYQQRSGHHAWVFWFCLTVFGNYFVFNLVLAVLAAEFADQKAKKAPPPPDRLPWLRCHHAIGATAVVCLEAVACFGTDLGGEQRYKRITFAPLGEWVRGHWQAVEGSSARVYQQGARRVFRLNEKCVSAPVGLLRDADLAAGSNPDKSGDGDSQDDQEDDGEDSEVDDEELDDVEDPDLSTTTEDTAQPPEGSGDLVNMPLPRKQRLHFLLRQFLDEGDKWIHHEEAALTALNIRTVSRLGAVRLREEPELVVVVSHEVDTGSSLIRGPEEEGRGTADEIDDRTWRFDFMPTGIRRVPGAKTTVVITVWDTRDAEGKDRWVFCGTCRYVLPDVQMLRKKLVLELGPRPGNRQDTQTAKELGRRGDQWGEVRIHIAIDDAVTADQRSIDDFLDCTMCSSMESMDQELSVLAGLVNDNRDQPTVTFCTKRIKDGLCQENFNYAKKAGLCMEKDQFEKLSRPRQRAMLQVHAPWFNFLFLVLTLANVIVLSLDRWPESDGLVRGIDITVTVCSIGFIIEAVAKISALTYRDPEPVRADPERGCKCCSLQCAYFRDRWNCFDFALVVLSIPDFLPFGGPGQNFNAFRAFRILRAFRLFKRFKSLRRVLATVLGSLADVSWLSVLILLCIFIFSVLGLHLFGDRFYRDEADYDDSLPEPYRRLDDRASFATFYESLIAVFVVMTAEGWGILMYHTMKQFHILSALYYVAIILVGHAVLLSLFVAIIVDKANQFDIEFNNLERRQNERSGKHSISEEHKRALELDRLQLEANTSNLNALCGVDEQDNYLCTGKKQGRFFDSTQSEADSDLESARREQQYQDDVRDQLKPGRQRRGGSAVLAAAQALTAGRQNVDADEGNPAEPRRPVQPLANRRQSHWGVLRDTVFHFGARRATQVTEDPEEQGSELDEVAGNGVAGPAEKNPFTGSTECSGDTPEITEAKGTLETCNSDRSVDGLCWDPAEVDFAGAMEHGGDDGLCDSDMARVSINVGSSPKHLRLGGGECEFGVVDQALSRDRLEQHLIMEHRVLAHSSNRISVLRRKYLELQTSLSLGVGDQQQRCLISGRSIFRADAGTYRDPGATSRSKRSRLKTATFGASKIGSGVKEFFRQVVEVVAEAAHNEQEWGEQRNWAPYPITDEDRWTAPKYNDLEKLKKHCAYHRYSGFLVANVQGKIWTRVCTARPHAVHEVLSEDKKKATLVETKDKDKDRYRSVLPEAPGELGPIVRAIPSVKDAGPDRYRCQVISFDPDHPKTVCVRWLPADRGGPPDALMPGERDRSEPRGTWERGARIGSGIDVPSKYGAVFHIIQLDPTLQGRALRCLTAGNCCRRTVHRIVQNQIFSATITFLIVANMVFISIDTPEVEDNNPALSETIKIADFVFAGLFIAECIMKIIAFGFYSGEHAYCSSRWNVVDFVVAITAAVGIFVPWMKMFRSLRTIRLIVRLVEVRLMVEWLFLTLPRVAHIVFLLIAFILIWAILGVSVFKGVFGHCSNRLIHNEANCTGTFTETVYTAFGPKVREADMEWEKLSYNFDNVESAMLTLFLMAIGDGWAEVMYAGMDSTGSNPPEGQRTGPNYNERRAAAVYFVIFMVVGQFFLMNLFVGVLINAFVKTKERETGQAMLSPEQESWIQAQRTLLQHRLERVLAPPDKASLFRRWCFDVAVSDQLEALTTLAIVVNAIVLSLTHWNEPTVLTNFAKAANIFFVVVFTLEAMVKIIGLGWVSYFNDHWNRFDFCIVLVSLIGVSVTDSSGTSTLRLLRILRMIRLIERWKGLRTLVHTLSHSLPQIWNVSLLLLTVFFMFGIAGVELFGRVNRDTNQGALLTEFTNFKDAYYALVTLYQISSTEGWYTVMRGTSLSPPRCDPNLLPNDNCGPPQWVSRLYFVLFMIVGSSLILNLFVTVVVDRYAEAKEASKQSDHLRALDDFLNKWRHADPQATGMLEANEAISILESLGPPMWSARKLHEGSTGFVETLRALEAMCIPVGVTKVMQDRLHVGNRRCVRLNDIVSCLAARIHGLDRAPVAEYQRQVDEDPNKFLKYGVGYDPKAPAGVRKVHPMCAAFAVGKLSPWMLRGPQKYYEAHHMFAIDLIVKKMRLSAATKKERILREMAQISRDVVKHYSITVRCHEEIQWLTEQVHELDCEEGAGGELSQLVAELRSRLSAPGDDRSQDHWLGVARRLRDIAGDADSEDPTEFLRKALRGGDSPLGWGAGSRRPSTAAAAASTRSGTPHDDGGTSLGMRRGASRIRQLSPLSQGAGMFDWSKRSESTPFASVLGR